MRNAALFFSRHGRLHMHHARFLERLSLFKQETPSKRAGQSFGDKDSVLATVGFGALYKN
jgi:hypothetical protein